MYALRRVGQGLLSLLVMNIAVWSLMAFTPGDSVLRTLQARGIPESTAEQVELLCAELDLDRPLILRYLNWMTGPVRGDLGSSWAAGRLISDEFPSRLPATVLLTVVALLPALALTMVLGILAALRASRWPDTLSRGFALVVLSLSSLLIGVVLVEAITLRLGLGRVLADGTIATVFLPAFTLALGSAATWSWLLCTGLLETRNAPFLSMVRSWGASRNYLLTRHLLPHTAPPMLTVIGPSAAAPLGGAPVAETVFIWPGVRLYVVKTIDTRDLPVVAATALFAVVVCLVTSLVTDLLLVRIDPSWKATT